MTNEVGDVPSVFISYSRRDRDFVRALHAALASQGRDTWVDWEDIPLTAEWLKEIHAGIEGADAFVFVISAESVASQVCLGELAHAITHSKRLIPVVHRDVPPKEVPEALALLNWVFFRTVDPFEKGVRDLMEAADRDLDWVRAHTRLLVRASEWNRSAKEDSLLLRGADLRKAEQWLATAGEHSDPAQTPLQAEYVRAGRLAERRRQRIALIASGVALIATIALGIFGWRQSGTAVEQRNLARSRELSAQAVAQLGVDSRSSLQLAIQAADAGPTSEAEDALRRWLTQPHALATLSGHSGWVNQVAFSADARLVVTASADHTARVWEAVTGRNTAVLSGHAAPVNFAAFSHDGRFVVTASDDMTAAIWDTGTGKRAGELRGHQGRVTSAVFSTDDHWIVTTSMGLGGTQARSGDDTTRVWDVGTRRVTAIFARKSSSDGAVTSSSGRFALMTTLGGAARVSDVENGRRLVADLPGEEAALSPDGTLVATGGDVPAGSIWNVNSGDRQLELRGHLLDLTGVAFSADGQFVLTGSQDNTARIWETESGKAVAELRGHSSRVAGGASGADGRLAATAPTDGTAIVWELNVPLQLARFDHPAPVATAAFDPTGRRVVTAADDGIGRIFETAGDRPPIELRGHSKPLRAAVFSPDGTRIATASRDGTARLWNAATGTSVAELRGHTGEVVQVAFNGDGSRLVTAGTDASARVWDARTGGLSAILSGHKGGVVSAVFSPDGSRVATAALDDTARVWDATTGSSIAVMQGHRSSVNTVGFSPDGRRLVTGSDDRTAAIWDVTSGDLITALAGHNDEGVRARFSPDGVLIVTTSEERKTGALTWDASTGGRLATFADHTEVVLGAAFSPDGEWVVTASQDKTARIWDARTGAMLIELRAHRGRVNTASFGPDGTRVVTASDDRTARVFGCEVCGSFDGLLAAARTWARRIGLTQERPDPRAERTAR